MGLRKFTIVIDEKYTEDVTMAFLRYADSFSFENVEDQPGFDLGSVSAADLRRLTATERGPGKKRKRYPGHKHARGNAYRLTLAKISRLESFLQRDVSAWLVAGGYSAATAYTTIQTLIEDGYVERGRTEGEKFITYYPTDKARSNGGEQAA